MFIDGFNLLNEGKENQVAFDSRVHNKQNKVKHRLDDVVSLLCHRKNVLVEIILENGKMEGIIDYIKDGKLKLTNDKTILEINKIKEINILRLNKNASNFFE